MRKLKSEKAAKDQVTEAVKQLLELKAAYKAAAGKDWKPDNAAPAAAAKGKAFFFCKTVINLKVNIL